MIILLRHNFQPLSGEAFYSKIIEFIGGSHFRPHQHPLHIAPIQKPGILNFHVLAQPVVAHFCDPIDVVDQCLLIRRCQMAAGPVALIQNQTLV
ncbi:hypothetical protein D3C73_1394140 [compost metagenome]